MRERRARYDGDDAAILDILKNGSRRANALAEETLALAKEAAGLGFFGRELRLT
jgi:tryptophanyl-tRNA synthetase